MPSKLELFLPWPAPPHDVLRASQPYRGPVRTGSLAGPLACATWQAWTRLGLSGQKLVRTTPGLSRPGQTPVSQSVWVGERANAVRACVMASQGCGAVPVSPHNAPTLLLCKYGPSLAFGEAGPLVPRCPCRHVIPRRLIVSREPPCRDHTVCPSLEEAPGEPISAICGWIRPSMLLPRRPFSVAPQLRPDLRLSGLLHDL